MIRVPPINSYTGYALGTPHRLARPKGTRGIGVLQSRKIQELAKELVPVGSAICRDCRDSIGGEGDLLEVKGPTESLESERIEQQPVPSTSGLGVPEPVPSTSGLSVLEPVPSTSGLEKALQHMTLEESQDSPSSSLSFGGTSPQAERSLYTVSSQSQTSNGEAGLSITKPKQLLEQLLQASDSNVDKVQVLAVPWNEASQRTQRFHLKQASETVSAVLQVLAPEDSYSLWKHLRESRLTDVALGMGGSAIEMELLNSLVECYKCASQSFTRRQILSIMADKYSFADLEKLLPGLTRYQVTSARQHAMRHGRGAPVPPSIDIRMRVVPGKLDHFITFITSAHVVQDLPFGEKVLKLSTGVSLKVPNTIRAMIPERIISQYQQYCTESHFVPMGKRTLQRVLAACSASVRTSLQGLDYFTAEGGRAFDDLEAAVDKLAEKQGQDWAKKQTAILRSSKRYLKGDYKVHVSQEATVAEHCRQFALSDGTDNNFSTTCLHHHDDECEACNDLQQLLVALEECFTVNEFETPEEKDDMRFTLDQAKQDIYAWQCHQLRSINQDEAWYALLDDLDDSSVLLVMDWAMKFLPRKYRESQTDWFGKRGLPWHISVAHRRCDASILVETFIHLFQTCTQDSSSVVSILQHTVQQLKEELPTLQSIYIRSDNAGCYHNTLLFQAAKHINQTAGVTIRRIDYCDPQGGKGSCDRQAATVKSHIKTWINEGHNVETATEFKTAVESRGGIPGVKVFLCEVDTGPGVTSTKLDGITKLNNFEFTEAGLRVWRAYNIGDGNIIPWSRLPAAMPPILLISSEPSNPGYAFRPIKSRQKKGQAQQEVESDSDGESTSEQRSLGSLFPCPEDSCVKVYQTCRGLEAHVAVGRHQRRLERETLLDKAKLAYAEKLEQGPSEVPHLEPSLEARRATPHPQQGWALRNPKKHVRFSSKQKEYLDKRFQLGEATGKKSDPLTVSKEMRHACDPQGKRLFQVQEFLTGQQVSSYFSRLAAKRRKTPEDEDDEQESAVVEAANTPMVDPMGE
ncbi:Hypp9299 [Branchiostoma lanceolatum]|uniref:Hypp9299 protein n=1 Tax=Branchiostoma lanceolatum TaxID=7740 RepID=A0A8J9ZFA9_BRALA|nr:Hypp9299 [Branchiostoma lanceolatum]